VDDLESSSWHVLEKEGCTPWLNLIVYSEAVLLSLIAWQIVHWSLCVALSYIDNAGVMRTVVLVVDAPPHDPKIKHKTN
jgi:hypothetical protein